MSDDPLKRIEESVLRIKQATQEFLSKLDLTGEERSFADQCGQAIFRAAVDAYGDAPKGRLRPVALAAALARALVAAEEFEKFADEADNADEGEGGEDGGGDEIQLEFPGLLQVDVFTRSDGTRPEFTDDVMEKIRESVEGALFALDREAPPVEGMRVRVSGSLVFPWRVGDQTTAFDRMLGKLNHLVRVVAHAETDKDWQGTVKQEFPPEVFDKLVEHVSGAVSILQELGLSADLNDWPESEQQ